MVREMAWKLVKNRVHQHSVATRLLNSLRGSNGSATRRSWTTKTSNPASAQSSRAATSEAYQAWPWPIRVMPSNRLLRPKINSAAPM
ncbi:hypothetical protein D3C84_831290 [compost metagenome]